MNKKHFLAAMYLRLSRDDSDVGDVTDKDGRLKSESNSIGNQRELIRAFIHEQHTGRYILCEIHLMCYDQHRKPGAC